MDAIAAQLEEQGHDCYVATRDIQAGRHISKKVMKELDKSEVLVVVLSTASNASPWVQQEIGYAKDRRPIIPIKTDSSKPLALLGGVEALALEDVPGELDGQIEQAIEGFEPSTDDADVSEEQEVCIPGPHEVEPGGYVLAELNVEPGGRYEGRIEEQDDESFDWAIIDEKNLLAFKRDEKWYWIDGEEDVSVGEVSFRIPLNRRGPWYLLLTAQRKQNTRILTVQIRPR